MIVITIAREFDGKSNQFPVTTNVLILVTGGEICQHLISNRSAIQEHQLDHKQQKGQRTCTIEE